MKTMVNNTLEVEGLTSTNNGREKIPFLNGTLDFNTREFTDEVREATLPGNYIREGNIDPMDSAMWPFFGSLNTSGYLAETGPEDGDFADIEALQRTLGAAIFLPKPYPAFLNIAGEAERYGLLECVKIATGDLAVHLGADAGHIISNLSPEGVRRLSRARLVIIDVPTKLSQAHIGFMHGLLVRKQVTTGVNYPTLTMPFSAMPILFSPDVKSIEADFFGTDESCVHQFKYEPFDEPTSLWLKHYVNQAATQKQIDITLRWLLDGAYREREYRKSPENNCWATYEMRDPASRAERPIPET